MSDTIFAVSSGAPPAAIAIVRVSGPVAFATIRTAIGSLPQPRVAGLRAIRDPTSGDLLDRALVLLFPGPDSATGEDLAELHLHGGRAVVHAVEAMLGRQPKLRPAEAGEFTRRALIAGRIDLSQAEGLGDLLSAETESQRRAAIGAAEGLVSREVLGWTQRVLALAAEVEAVLDFSDEDDVIEAHDIAPRAMMLGTEIAAVAGGPVTERLRDGIRVVLAGPPNSGKSTLFNALVEREAAIVSPIAGTTRDRIEAPIARDGIAYVLTDTAGLTETDDPIEAIGVARAREALAGGDVILWLGEEAPNGNAIWVQARADEPGRGALLAGRALSVSAQTGNGMAALWRAVGAHAATLLPRLDGVALNRRQQTLCLECAAELGQVGKCRDLLLMAEHLRRARVALDRILGTADVEAMLDGLFGRFCIGK